MKKIINNTIVRVVLFSVFINVLVIYYNFNKLPDPGKVRSVYVSQRIKWEDRKLEITDFYPTNEPVDVTGSIAVSCTGIAVSERRNPRTKRFDIYAEFDRKCSKWYLYHTTDINYILNHEQRHFDITHIVSQWLKKHANDHDDHIGRDFDQSLYDQAYHVLDSMQTLYDRETEHSRNVKMQKIWDVKIDSIISLLPL